MNNRKAPMDGVHSWMAACTIGEIILGSGYQLSDPKRLMNPPGESLRDRRFTEFHPDMPALLGDMLKEDPKQRISVSEALQRFEESIPLNF